MKNFYIILSVLFFIFSTGIASAQTTLISEDFTSGIPATWTVQSGGNCVTGWQIATGAGTLTGDHAFASSWAGLVGGCIALTYLMTPVADASSYTSATLTFDHDFSPWWVDTAEVWCYSSSLGWSMLQRFTSTISGTVSISLDNYLSDSLVISFDYWGEDGDYWGIDNVKVEATGGGTTPLADSTIVTDISCNGNTDGMIEVFATGGASPYSYAWNTTATTSMINNLSAGIYTCTITDANGTNIIVLDTIIEPALITSTDVQTACNTFTWIDGNTYTASNNSATWTLQTASGCDSIITLNLTMTSTINTTDVQTACNTFTWIDGNAYTASNNSATWTLQSASGCDSIITLDLTINSNASSTDVQTACDSYTWIDGNTYTSSNNTASYTSTTVSGCDSIITLDLTINSNASSTDAQTACNTYTWIDGNTYTSSNNSAAWTLQLASGCDSIVTLDLTITGNPSAIITQNGTDLEVTSATTYNWNTGETTQVITPTANGWYWCFVVDANGCMSDTAMFEVTNIISSVSELTKNSFEIYPNPNNGLLTIEFKDNNSKMNQINIINLTGEIIFTENVKSSNDMYKKLIDLSNTAKGIYFVKVISEFGEVNKKLVIQ